MKQKAISLKIIKLKNSSKIDKEKKKTLIANITNKTKDIITDPTDTKRLIKESYKQLYTNKCDNLKRKWANSSKSTNYHNSPI